MTHELWYFLPAGVLLLFLGAALRAGVLRRAKPGFLATLLAVVIAAGTWYLWQSDGSMGPARPFCALSFAAGTLIGEGIVFFGRKSKRTYHP